MTQQNRSYLAVALAAGAFLMVTMGVRQSFGLFISPLNTSTGLGIATISFALAIGQFTWGAVQPVAGALADRYGPGKVLFAGPLILACGMALTPFMDSGLGLIVSLGLLASIGSGAGSFSVLLGAASQRLPPESRGRLPAWSTRAARSAVVFAPVAQALISAFGWMAALWSLAAMTLAALPLVRRARRPARPAWPRGESPWRASATTWAIAATCCCTPDSSPADSTSRFW
jgi:MFS family permease